MTTSGKVFACLNIIMVLVYMALAAPIAKHRIDTQILIQKEKEKIPGLELATHELERERVKLQEDITRQQGMINNVANNQAILEADQQKSVAILVDLLQDAQDKVKRWTTSLADVKSEVEARTAELAGLDKQLVDDGASLKTLNDEIAELEGRLDKAQKDYAASRKRIEQNYQQILLLEEDAKKRADQSSASLAP